MKRFILFFIFVLIINTYLFAQKDCNDPTTFMTNYDIEVTPIGTWATDSQSITANECVVYKVNMAAGFDYIFKTGCDDGATADFDTRIDVYDSTGSWIIGDDDSCEDYRSSVTWTATETVAYVKVRGFNSTQFGDFTLAYWSSWSPPIYVPDDNFRAAVNDELGQPEDYHPTIEDLNGLTGELDVSDNEIVSIEGAQYLTGLDELKLHKNQISDISPVAGLTNLEKLYLHDNQIIDISPVTGLTALEYLKLSLNEIEDISPVAGLTELRWLYIHSNQIRDISAISGLTALRRLYLYNNEITDIFPLVENTEFGDDDVLYLERYDLGNPLSVEALSIHIPILESRDFDTIEYPAAPNLEAGCYPYPERDEIAIYPTEDLNWQGNFPTDDATYKVYFGTSAANMTYVGDGVFVSGTNYSFDPTLADLTEYWWQIETVTATGSLWSGIWHFTSGEIVPLNAEFVADQTAVYTGSNVQFTDLSSGVPINWGWDFNGDMIADSYEQNPTFAYNTPGVYTVSMEIFDGSSYDLETKTNYITVTDIVGVQPIGIGTLANPYQIETLGNLLWVSENETSWDKHFIQTADIDASSTINWNGGLGFNPIGDYVQTGISFAGSYNGQDHVIDGLYINTSAYSYRGFFGVIESGEVANLGLTNINISGYERCGGLAGLINVGSITNCYTTGSVATSSNQVGGLVGITWSLVMISDCYSSATVSAAQSVGGLVGMNQSGSSISKCYATGNVSGVVAIGGLVGVNSDGAINDCYSTGSVMGESNIGGLVGFSSTGVINHCYSTGAVTGLTDFGGLIGFGSGTVTESYWDIDTSGLTISVGGEGKTTSEMMLQSTYNNWDFTTTWFMENGINNGYPFLDDIEHFVPCWSGNGYQNMQIFINSAEIKGVPVTIGDEIGLFDGDLCVGGGTITAFNPPFLIEIVAAADDPLTPGIDGFIDGHPIDFQIWDNDNSISYTNVSANYQAGNGLFTTFDYALVDLQADDSIITYPYLSGWNLGSFAVLPFDYDLQVIMDPLITNGSLVQVQDEAGSILCNLPTIGWYNGIGDMMHTEGYYINMNQDDNLTVMYNHQVHLPLDIPFTQGWNIMGFPYNGAVNAQEVVQPLINSGNLVKVIAESGDAIWYDNIAGTWINDIGNMSGGKGYFLNVNADCVLTFVEPSDCAGVQKKSQNLSQLSGRETFHFQPVWQYNPFLPMNFYVSSLQLSGLNLQPEDELAIFDGELCVGTTQVGEEDLISLVAATNDVITEFADGFINGNEFNFKYWDSSEDAEYNNFQVTTIYGDDVFVSQGTSQIEITFLPTGSGNDLLPMVTKINQNYPNPFNPETNIAFSMKDAGHVTIEIFNLKGQKVTTLTNGEYEVGYHNLTWQSLNETGHQVGSGVYFYKFSVNGKTKDMKKMLLLK
jgi:PKD repeat protein